MPTFLLHLLPILPVNLNPLRTVAGLAIFDFDEVRHKALDWPKRPRWGQRALYGVTLLTYLAAGKAFLMGYWEAN